jgi:hypothetical protein
MSHNPAAWSETNAADDLVTTLASDGTIPANTFAFGLRGYTDDDASFIDIGFYNDDAMNDPTDLIWTDVVTDYYFSDYWWANYMTGVRFRDQESGSITYADSVANADEYSTVTTDILSIVDSGSSCLVLSSSVYDFVLSTLKDYLTTYNTDVSWGTIFNCNTNLPLLPIIGFLYDGYWLEAIPEDYTV